MALAGQSLADLENTKGTELLTVSGLTKVFGTLKANDNVDLDVHAGEIHALLGENGAGKSTLVKMLFGSLQPTSGTIVWRGNKVIISNPSEARILGIGMVFQHFSLFDALTVAENIALSLGDNVEMGELAEKTRSVSQEYGLPLDPDALVGDLSVGERQRIEIVRCLLQDPALIILDEPTSVLTPQEANKLFETLERLAGEGRSILYISHRLEEVQRLCSRATILRHGKVVDACDPREETAASLASKMVGAEIDVVHRDNSGEVGDVLLSLNSLSMPAASPFAMPLRNISLDLRAGEVVGIAGVAGNGQSELFDAVSGETPQDNASDVTINGNPAGRMDISERRKLGAAFVPEERLGHGAVPSFALSENLLLARHRSDKSEFLSLGALGMINRSKVQTLSRQIVEDMDVRKSGEDPAASALSGGNLQKFIVGRELDRNPSVLIVNQPTWGVDAGAAARIRQALIDLAASGAAVMVISQDLDEIFEVSDRITVISDGGLSEPEPAKNMTREKIGMLMGASHQTDVGKMADNSNEARP